MGKQEDSLATLSMQQLIDKHRKHDAELQAALKEPRPDHLNISRLKKLKLQCKDRIAFLENEENKFQQAA